MKRTIVVLPFAALLIWLAAAQSPVAFFNTTTSPPGFVLKTHGFVQDSAGPGIRAFLTSKYRQTLGLTTNDSFEVLALLKDARGGLHARLQQTFRGIPVLNARYNIHARNGQITSANGAIVTNLDLSVTPALSETEALAKALVALSAQHYAWQDVYFESALRRSRNDPRATFFPKGALVIVPLRVFPKPGSGVEDTYRLAWRFDVYAIEPDLVRELIFVDALNGSILHRLPQIAACAAPAQGKAAYIPGMVSFTTDSCNNPALPKYRLHDPLRKIEVFDAQNTQGTPPFGFFNASVNWTPPLADTVAVAVHWSVTQWYNYLEKFNWLGFEGIGSPMLVWVHSGKKLQNAFYDGFLRFGDGDPAGEWPRPLVSTDIVAHECTHGLIEHTCGLLYVYEPGIINESIADIFGCLVESEYLGENWLLGEAVRPNPARRLDAPNVLGLPDTYQGNYWVNQSTPNEALHSNSTVLGHWFYLLAKGGNGFNDFGDQYHVNGIGRNEAARLLLHAMRYYLNPADGFFDFRHALIIAAGNLNWNQAEIDNLAQAFYAVGIGGSAAQGNESIVLNTPNGGEVYQPGDAITVSWNQSPGVTSVKILFSANAGASWENIDTLLVSGTSGSYNFAAPKANSHLCRLRVSALDDPLAFDASDSLFTILGCNLLAGFNVTPQSGCFGTNFGISNVTAGATAQWLVDDSVYPAPAGGFTLIKPGPGQHKITLIASNGACTDTFSRTIKVAPVPSANFHYSVSNLVITAAAEFSGGEQYFWSVDGQSLPAFKGSKSMNWTAPGPGKYQICLFVDDGCSVGGEVVCEEVVVTESAACQGETEKWEQFTYTNEVLDIADQEDTLWIATLGGLVKYVKTNGERTFYNSVNSGIPCLPVNAVAIGNDGRKLIGTPCGLAIFDGVNWSTVSSTKGWLVGNFIIDFEKDESGIIYMCHRGNSGTAITRFGTNGDTTVHYTGNISARKPMQAIGTALYFISTGLSKLNSQHIVETISHPNFPNESFTAISVDTEGNIFLGTQNKGIFKYYPATKNLEIFTANSIGNSCVPWNTYHTLKFYQNAIWYSGYKVSGVDYPRIGYFNGSLCHEYGSSTGLSSIIEFFFIDNKNILWAGSDNGLFRFDPAGNQWTKIDLSSNGLQTSVVTDIVNKKDGSIWIANQSKFINTSLPVWTEQSNCSYAHYLETDSFDNLWGRFYNFYYNFGGFPVTITRIARITEFGVCQTENGGLSFPETNPYFRDIKSWGKFMIVATAGNIFALDIEKGGWINFTEKYGVKGYKFGGGKHQSLWVVQDTNFIELKKDFQTDFHPFFQKQGNASLVIDIDGTKWAAYQYPVGLSGIKNLLKKNVPGSSNWVDVTNLNQAVEDDIINAMELDAYHNLWIGYSSKGLAKLSPDGSFKIYNRENSDIPANSVYGIAFKQDGAVLIATSNGIAILSPSSSTIQPVFQLPANICAGSKTHFVNTTGGATSWQWAVNGQPAGTSRHLDYSFPAAGEYIVELTAFNAQGCSTSVSRAVMVHPVADLSGFPASVVECTSTFQLCAPESMAFYEWKDGAGIVRSNERCYTVGQINSGFYNLKIRDFCGNEKSAATSVVLSGTCVTPGDLNDDGQVNFIDQLWLGYTFGFSGPPRQEQGIVCGKYPASEWNGNLPSAGNNKNFKHCDANGDGRVDLADAEAIDHNYRTCGSDGAAVVSTPGNYAFVPKLVSIGVDTFGHDKYTLQFDIVANNGNGGGIDHFYGAGMRIHITVPTGLHLEGTPTFTFNNSVLGTNGVDGAGLVKPYIDEGFIDVAYTRLDHVNQSNVALLGGLTFLVIDDNLVTNDTLFLSIDIKGAAAITSEGNFLPIGGESNQYNITTGISEQAPFSGKLMISPNPATDRCHLDLELPVIRTVDFQLSNAQGNLVWALSETSMSLSRDIDLSAIPAGVYFLTVTTGQERTTRRIIKL